jgi:uncharacterized protein YacL
MGTREKASRPIEGWRKGIFVALLVVRIEQDIRKVSLKIFLGGVAGLVVGLCIAFLFSFGLKLIGNTTEKQIVAPWVYTLISVIMAYLGIVLGSKKIDEFFDLAFTTSKERLFDNVRILDTSVIIDGRIADVCDTGFIEGNLIVPRFVLEELQYIADSSDSIKRSRGRRGLDILNRMQKSTGINIEVVEQDFPELKGVDAKLVAMARKMSAKIVTNDFNLNKVAELQGIKILNINELANAVKPLVLPGEPMTVKIIKEGKEPGQGVAYLDDGTMIVVDNAQQCQGLTVEVWVTSVLQTTAGRMIFAELKEPAGERKSPIFVAKR